MKNIGTGISAMELAHLIVRIAPWALDLGLQSVGQRCTIHIEVFALEKSGRPA